MHGAGGFSFRLAAITSGFLLLTSRPLMLLSLSTMSKQILQVFFDCLPSELCRLLLIYLSPVLIPGLASSFCKNVFTVERKEEIWKKNVLLWHFFWFYEIVCREKRNLEKNTHPCATFLLIFWSCLCSLSTFIASVCVPCPSLIIPRSLPSRRILSSRRIISSGRTRSNAFV